MEDNKAFDVSNYVRVVDDFVRGKITVDEFECLYLKEVKNDPRILPEELFKLIDKLFFDVDKFVSDPNIRDANDLDEGQLFESARKILQSLKQFDKAN